MNEALYYIDKIQSDARLLKHIHMPSADFELQKIQNDVRQALRVFVKQEREKPKDDGQTVFADIEKRTAVCSLLHFQHRAMKIYNLQKVYNQFVHEKPPRDPVFEQIKKIDCGVLGPSYDELRELLQLNKEGFLPRSSFLFLDCPDQIDSGLQASVEELNSLCADKAQRLIKEGRALERDKLVQVSGDGFLPEPISIEAADQYGAELVKELLKESKENRKVLQELSRNSCNWANVTALLQTLAGQTQS